MSTARRRHAGFTLVEVLVGTTVLAILVSLLTSALFTVTRSARSGELRLDTVDADRLIQSFIRRELREAVPLTIRENASETVVFEARNDELRFVGHLPAHRGGGGLHLMELRMEPAEKSNALVLYFRAAWPGATFSGTRSAPWSRRALVSEVASAQFSFYGRVDDDDPLRWHDRWADASRLPDLIQLDVELDGNRHWAPLVVEVATPTARGQPQLYRDALERTP